MSILYHNTSLPKPIIADAVHIDTVQLSHSYHAKDLPPREDFKKLNFDMSIKNRGFNEIVTAHSKSIKMNSHEPHLTVIRSEYGYCGIKAEVSIAKLLDGNGLDIQTNDGIECALDTIESYIYQRLEVDFDARTAKVKRLDVNADFPVGEKRISPYLHALSSPNSRLKRGEFGSTTAIFFNDSRTFIVYGKKAEMENEYRKGRATFEDVEKAEGLLRVESRLKTLQAVNRLAEKLSLPFEAGKLLSLPVASYLISDALTLLNLDKPKIGNVGRNASLVECFGKKAAQMLGFLEFRKFYGENFWKTLGFSQATFYKKRKELVDVNLWNISPAQALPALLMPDVL